MAVRRLINWFGTAVVIALLPSHEEEIRRTRVIAPDVD
jgi:hypothetical protein